MIKITLVNKKRRWTNHFLFCCSLKKSKIERAWFNSDVLKWGPPNSQSPIKLLFLEKCCIILSNRTKFLVNRTYVCLLGDKYCTIREQLITKGWFLMVEKIIKVITQIDDVSKLNTIYNFILGLMKKGWEISRPFLFCNFIN